MGKGLIPADLETWRPRRRAIVPAFHRAYLEAMTRMFGACTQRSIDKFNAAIDSRQVGKAAGACLVCLLTRRRMSEQAWSPAVPAARRRRKGQSMQVPASGRHAQRRFRNDASVGNMLAPAWAGRSVYDLLFQKQRWRREGSSSTTSPTPCSL